MTHRLLQVFLSKHPLLQVFVVDLKFFRREPVNTTYKYLSAEFLLDIRPNGGTVIALRSLYVAILVLLLTLLLYNVLDPRRSCIVVWERKCDFDYLEMFDQVVRIFSGWFAAVLAAVYVALYSRFQSQWSYLANLYNQIKASEARTAHDWSHRSYGQFLCMAS